MRGLHLLVVVIAAWLASGCYVVSVHGIADPAAVVFDEALLGQWKNAEGDQDPEELLVERDEWRTYAVTVKDRRAEPQRFTVRLVKIGQLQYFDATIHGGTEPGPALLPVHVVGRVAIRDGRLEVETPDYDWFSARLNRGSLTVAAVLTERDTILITATPARVRRWLAANAAASMFDMTTFVK